MRFWLFNTLIGILKNGVRTNAHNTWVGFHPLYTLQQPGFLSIAHLIIPFHRIQPGLTEEFRKHLAPKLEGPGTLTYTFTVNVHASSGYPLPRSQTTRQHLGASTEWPVCATYQRHAVHVPTRCSFKSTMEKWGHNSVEGKPFPLTKRFVSILTYVPIRMWDLPLKQT